MPLTPEQRERRKTMLGGSDAGRLFGDKPDPLGVYADKVLGRADESSGDAAELGTEMEGPERERAAKRLGVVINVPTETIIHPQYPWMGANLDGRIQGGGIWEGKVLFDREKASRLGEPGSDRVLPNHFWQCVHYMEVTGEPWTVVSYLLLIGRGAERRDFLIQRDEELGAQLIAHEERFWREHVIPQIPPATDDPFALTEYLAQKFPVVARTEPLRAEPGTGAEEALRELERTSRALKAAQKERQAAIARVQMILGDADRIECAFGKATWKASKSVAWASVARELGASPALVKKFTRVGRTFRSTFDDDAESASEE